MPQMSAASNNNIAASLVFFRVVSTNEYLDGSGTHASSAELLAAEP